MAILLPRVTPLPAKAPAPAVVHGLAVHPGEQYVLTGGTGGIGSTVVAWLIDSQGVAPSDIVLLSRRSNPDHPRGVRVIAVDCCDEAALLDCAELRTLNSVRVSFSLTHTHTHTHTSLFVLN